MQDPWQYLSDLQIDVDCAVAPGHKARIGPEYASFINHDVYFTSTQARKLEFDRNPFEYVHVLADPVTRQRFRPGSDSPHTTHKGREFYFASDSTAAMFAAMPDSFQVPQFGMIPASRVPGLEEEMRKREEQRKAEENVKGTERTDGATTSG